MANAAEVFLTAILRLRKLACQPRENHTAKCRNRKGIGARMQKDAIPMWSARSWGVPAADRAYCPLLAADQAAVTANSYCSADEAQWGRPRARSVTGRRVPGARSTRRESRSRRERRRPFDNGAVASAGRTRRPAPRRPVLTWRRPEPRREPVG